MSFFPPPLTEYKKNLILLGIILSVLTFWLFTQSMVNIGPVVSEQLLLDDASTNLMVSLASFVCGMTIVGLGKFADRLGCTSIFVVGNLLNIAGSSLLAFTPSGDFATVLVVTARILQGLSGAAVMASSLALVGRLWTGRKRSRAVSLWSIGSWGGAGFCAAFSGYIAASQIGWKGLFIISALISVLSIWLTIPAKNLSRASVMRESIDYRGMLIFALVIACVQVLISYASILTISAMLVFVGLLLVLVFFLKNIEKKVENPLIDKSLLANKPFVGACSVNFLVSATGGSTAVALWIMQDGFGLSVAEAGAASIGFALGVVLCIRLGELLMRRFGSRIPIFTGSTIVMISLVLMMLTFLPRDSYVAVTTLAFTLYGIGVGLCATPTTDTAI